jgi:hypothetical protein
MCRVNARLTCLGLLYARVSFLQWTEYWRVLDSRMWSPSFRACMAHTTFLHSIKATVTGSCLYPASRRSASISSPRKVFKALPRVNWNALTRRQASKSKCSTRTFCKTCLHCCSTVVQFNATCFSLFPDAGMADLLDALDSRNDGEQKCLSRWLCDFDPFKK